MPFQPVREQLPRFIEPMLASPTRELPDSASWAVELKWDGCRAQLIIDRGAWTLRSRPGRCMTATFGELEPLAVALAARRVILDGELVCLDADGKPDFHQLRPRITGSPGAHATYIAFDVLHLDGVAVRQLPYRERRSMLQQLLPARGPGWVVPRPLVGEPAQILALLARERLEGVVAKHLQRPYQPGRRTANWVKRKIRRAETFTVTAYRPAQPDAPDTIFVSRRAADGQLRPAGAVQLGLNADQRAALRTAIEQRISSSRRRIAPVADGINVVVDYHGAEHGPLRDPVMRSFTETLTSAAPRAGHGRRMRRGSARHVASPPVLQRTRRR